MGVELVGRAVEDNAYLMGRTSVLLVRIRFDDP